MVVFAATLLLPVRAQALLAPMVVADDKDYAPYAFLDGTGTPRGITIDVWKLWSEKTGIPLEFRLLEWEAALADVREGRADVVGGLFRTPQREALFDFGPHSIAIPTAVFFHSSLTGIRGIQDLTGFNIGVVGGDSAEELVRTRHPQYTVTAFSSTRELVQAATSGRIKVFIADSPTAGFYLAQFPEGAEFRQASDLIQVNPLHWAVRKGNHQTLAVIEAGFSKITQEELRAIEEDWSGRAISMRFPWRQALGGAAVLALALGVILLWNLTLRRQVRAKTEELAQSMRDLRKSEGDYRLLVENQTEILVKVDAQGHFLYVSPSYCKTFGRSSEELLGTAFMPLVHEDDRDATMKAMQALNSPPHTAYMEQRALTVHGWRWLAWNDSAILGPDGKIQDIIGVGRDITDLKLAEEALRESEARYRSVIENIQDMYYRTDIQGRLVLLSPSTPRHLGYDSVDAVLGCPAADFWMQPELRQELLRRIKAEGSVKDYEVLLKTKDGKPLLVSATSAYYHDNEGNVLGVEGIFRDITERKRTEEALKKSYDELELRVAERTRELTEANARLTELDSLKSAFLNTVSHDLRTPLTSILGFSKIVQRDFTRRFLPLAEGDKVLSDKASSILDNLGVIVSEGERLARLVNDFLDLSRIEEGRYSWRDTLTNMGTLIKDTASSLKGALLQSRGVLLRMDIPSDLPELYVDPDRISQVLTNLLSNAIKFTPEGTVTLTAAATSEGIRVSVADTGIGISPDELPKVFDKFFQAAEDTLQAEKGTGLGLAICKQIVEHYHGTLWAESTLGVGSVFSFELPFISPITTPKGSEHTP